MTCWRRRHSHPHRSPGSSPFGKVKTLGSFSLKAQFQCTHTKELNSRDLPHRSQKQGGTMTQEKGIPPLQVMSEQEIESMVAYIT